MDFEDTPEEAAFRAEVHAWLADNATPARNDQADDLGLGDSRDVMAGAKAWQAKKAAKGYARIAWPKEAGGLGGTAIQQAIYNQEEAKFDVPDTRMFAIGLGMCIPTLMAYASKDVGARYVAPALAGEEIWCQLFLRTGRRLGRRGSAHACREARRRLDRQRPEDLDFGRAFL